MIQKITSDMRIISQYVLLYITYYITSSINQRKKLLQKEIKVKYTNRALQQSKIT